MNTLPPSGASIICKGYHAKVDRLQVTLAQFPQVETKLVHTFTPGLYTRTIHVPAGTLVITKIHRTEHPFAVLQGRASILTPEGTVEHVKAPHIGVTKSGTRRVLFCHEDVVWSTFHPTQLTDPESIEAEIIEPRDLSSVEPVTIGSETLKQLQEVSI